MSLCPASTVTKFAFARQIGEVRDVVPRLAAVHRVVDLSGAAARPDDARLHGRDREIGDRWGLGAAPNGAGVGVGVGVELRELASAPEA